MTKGDGPAALAALSHLVDPVRRHLYEYVTSRSGPVTREEAATAASIGRAAAGGSGLEPALRGYGYGSSNRR